MEAPDGRRYERGRAAEGLHGGDRVLGGRLHEAEVAEALGIPGPLTGHLLQHRRKLWRRDIPFDVERYEFTELGIGDEVTIEVAAGTNTLYPEGLVLLPGETKELVITLEAGTFQAACHIPKHYGRGMWAPVNVVE